MEILEGGRKLRNQLEGDFEEEFKEIEDNKNPFHAPVYCDQTEHGGHADRLVRALDLNIEGVRNEILDFHGKMHVENFLDWESNLENYFESKPMVEDRKVLFVKMKVNQWWKRLEEQHVS